MLARWLWLEHLVVLVKQQLASHRLSETSVLPVRPLRLLLALQPLLALPWARQWLRPRLPVLPLPRQKFNRPPCKSRHRLLRLPP